MKKIYVAHSTGYDYKNELYAPIRSSKLNTQYSILLPHEKSAEPFNAKEYFTKEANLIIAEISHASTGMGIELGWADYMKIPVICIYKKNSNYSKSAIVIAKEMIEYNSGNDLIEKLAKAIEKY